jgi:GntR family transcriptional regulator, vanillate catabolism transcriptional regulator
VEALTPLPPRIRLVDDVVHQLRQDIVSGRLPAGTQLLQVDLARQLGVSRTPLREALRILEHDGLLHTSNNNRTVEVVTVNSARLRDMYEVREVVDGLAARLAARQALSPEAIAEANHLLDEMAAAAKPYDPMRRTAAHSEFHAFFVRHASNDTLEGFLPLIRLSSAALYLPFLYDPDAVELVNSGKIVTHKQLLDEAQHSHSEVLKAVVARQPAKAEAAARRHIRRTLAGVDQLDEWRRTISEASLAQEQAQQNDLKAIAESRQRRSRSANSKR